MIAVNIDYTFPKYLFENQHLYKSFFRFNSPVLPPADQDFKPLRIYFADYWVKENLAHNFISLMLDEFKVPYIYDPKTP